MKISENKMTKRDLIEAGINNGSVMIVYLQIYSIPQPAKDLIITCVNLEVHEMSLFGKLTIYFYFYSKYCRILYI